MSPRLAESLEPAVSHQAEELRELAWWAAVALPAAARQVAERPRVAERKQAVERLELVERTRGGASGWGTVRDVLVAPGWTLCCGQCGSPAAGVCLTPCPPPGGAGPGGGSASAGSSTSSGRFHGNRRQYWPRGRRIELSATVPDEKRRNGLGNTRSRPYLRIQLYGMHGGLY